MKEKREETEGSENEHEKKALVDDVEDDPSGPTAGQGQVVEVHPSVALVDAKYQPMTALHLTQEQPQYQQLQQPASLTASQTQILQQGNHGHTMNESATLRLTDGVLVGNAGLQITNIHSLPSRLNQQQQQQLQSQQVSAQDAMIETTPQVGAEQVVTTDEGRDETLTDANPPILDNWSHLNRSNSNARKNF